jgi:pyruvate dehydrogenase E1 component alpha subunit
MGTSVERTSNVHELYTLGESYDMPGEPVDGMRCEDVHDAITKACSALPRGQRTLPARDQDLPVQGHSMSDPQKYRTKEEVEEYKKQDPIEAFAPSCSWKQVGHGGRTGGHGRGR